MKLLILIRGLPGSGKSTLAAKLSLVRYEADDYFLTEEGDYVFDGTKVKDAHLRCVENTESAMRAGSATITVANTFTRLWEMEPYIALAEQYQYTVQILHCLLDVSDAELARRNIHGVLEETIHKMRARWENLT